MTTAEPQLRLAATDRVHLVGVGGAGMSALARILLERGHPVSGSDLRGGREATALRAMGADVHVGHAAGHADGADLVAVSSAVPVDNVEVRHARELGVPVIRRAELLAALVGDRRGVFVAGTHGKTTTTSMLVVALQAAGVDPSFAIGGTLHDASTSAHHGSGDLFVAEADESDRSFLVYEPDCAVVTNVELDHHDTYERFDDVMDAFGAFLSARRPGGAAVLCRDDEGAALLAERAGGTVVTYGEHPDADVRLVDIRLAADGSYATVLHGAAPIGRLALPVPGRHNLHNAAGVAAAALWAGADSDRVLDGLRRFHGAQRRFQRMGEAAGVTVVDDYAHHPTELSVTVDAARQTAPSGRVIAVFQPHRYSRTEALGRHLGRALRHADIAIITDVYGAGESPVPGVTGELVVSGAREVGVETHYVPRTAALPDAIAAMVAAGDLVLTLGAGDITEIGPQLLHRLEGGGG